ncbi:MAG: sulfatase-like hydrolase/transferase [Bacteroidales bacterium]|nr:sulfatase-like hydrolase/transferase [Bacteroidales bacterium]
MNKVSLISLAVLIFAGCAKEPVLTPNVVILLADDLGYNDLSCYRNNHDFESDQPPTCVTPNIDKLAAMGLRCTDFYAGAAVCSPSRSALMTGRNATRVGIYNWIPPGQPMHLRDTEITIAEMLKQKDYRTGHFGKWHLTSEGMEQPIPNDQGFDYSFFTYNNANPSHHNPVNFFRNGNAEGKIEGYSCQIVMDEALNWLDTIHQTGNPFFLNIWFNEPHNKVAAPPELANRHKYKKEYYGCIENMDIAVGRLLSYLEKNELGENTIVIFASDNGSDKDNSNLPLRGRKALNFEGGIRDPFIIRFPGHIPEGKTSGFPGSFTDVLPTIAAYTGTRVPADRTIDGSDLSEVLKGNVKEINRNTPIFFFRYFHDPVIMLRKGDWCLLGFIDPIPLDSDYNVRELAKIKPKEGEPAWVQWRFRENHMQYLKEAVPHHFELYNLQEDISQENDLSSLYPDRLAVMKEDALHLRNEMIEEGGNWYNGN